MPPSGVRWSYMGDPIPGQMTIDECIAQAEYEERVIAIQRERERRAAERDAAAGGHGASGEPETPGLVGHETEPPAATPRPAGRGETSSEGSR